MRTYAEAVTLIKMLVPKVTGLPLSELFTLSLSNDDFGTPLGAVVSDDDGSSDLWGLTIAPRRYWQELRTEALLAIIAQEHAHGECTEFPLLMNELTEKVQQIKIDFAHEGPEAIAMRQNRIREDYELGKGFIIGIASWKLHCDLIAINRLRSQGLPIQGQLEWLQAEFEEEGRQPLLRSRRNARQWLVRVRILHSRLIITNTQRSSKEAACIRNYIKDLSGRILSNQTPQT